MTDVDYWLDLPDKCKTDKRARFNYIMAKINEDGGSSNSTSSENTDDGE
ncbi:hypothetical protein [uncultured Methanobrevibacter sp.]|nr:hypothetical protein [uncultured Methanobrevibacter sp.]